MIRLVPERVDSTSALEPQQTWNGPWYRLTRLRLTLSGSRTGCARLVSLETVFQRPQLTDQTGAAGIV
jgi:hypothetical protein